MSGLQRFNGTIHAMEQACSLESAPQYPARSRTNNNTLAGMVLFAGFLLAILALVGTVSAYTTPDGISSAGNVYVSSVTIDPAVLFSGDKATATYFVTNGNANKSIAINHVSFGESKDIRLTSDSYDTNANIGPLQTRSFVFTIQTDSGEGSYYPTFSMSFRDADSLYYRTQVKVDNTPLVVTIVDKPDTFTQNKKDSITVQIANPRENDVKNVILDVTGDGVTATPSEIYLGVLASGADMNSTFLITPGQESPVNITVKYDNGDNHHVVSLAMPVSFAPDKKKASPQMSNVKVKLDSGVYDVTGDITNSGLENANGVSVAALSPAVPQDPYKTYVIGALKPDDFGSFEVTFKASGAGSVPLQISYKDTDGNVITSQQDVALTVTDSAQTQNSPSFLPVIAIILLIAVGGGYLYYRRKKNQ
ncbi:COG1361 S-layer family protein [Methanoregula sp.]|uniref:COG1361 S-layer family protein n=1 Tax=Methanoregula sp. TaxID=2052170 RepID=UPI003C20F351